MSPFILVVCNKEKFNSVFYKKLVHMHINKSICKYVEKKTVTVEHLCVSKWSIMGEEHSTT